MKEWGRDPDAALKTSLVVVSCIVHFFAETHMHELVFDAVVSAFKNVWRRVHGDVTASRKLDPERTPQIAHLL